MKNVCLYIGLLVLLCTQGFSQGTDVIFWLDNSESIQENDFLLMKEVTQTIMQDILSCNENNRIAVVNYAATGAGGSNSKIYIESDFSSNYAILSSFENRNSVLGDRDYAHEALALIAKALDHINDSHIVSNIKTLNHSPNKNLAVFLITDSSRSAVSGSCLVNSAFTTVGSNEAFINYTTFKNEREAKFITLSISPQNSSAAAAAAAISSIGGNYNGAIESYPNDPDLPGTLGRMTVVSSGGWGVSGFAALTEQNIELLGKYICSVNNCPEYSTLSSLEDDVSSGQDNHQAEIAVTASNKITGSAEAIYHAGEDVVLTSGFHSTNGSRFRGYIEGCTGNFVGRIGQFEDEGQLIQDKETSFFSLAPNPANSIITITATEDMKDITITSQDGKTLYSRAMPDKTTSIDIPVASYSNGIYTVTVTTADGKIQTKKLVKN